MDYDIFLELGEAPEDFSERLETLKMRGLILYAKHHHSYELEDCLPTYQIIISNETVNKNSIEVLKDVISSSKELMGLLSWYAEIDQESVSKSQWQADFINETNNNNSSWKALDAECPLLGAYSPVSKLNRINIGILASKLLKDQTEDEAVFELTPDSEDLMESMADVFGEFRSDLGTPLALQCLQRSTKLLAEIRTWLYSGYAITEYDLTSSTTYMVIQRPFAMRVLIAQNKSDGKIYAYFFHMQFDF